MIGLVERRRKLSVLRQVDYSDPAGCKGGWAVVLRETTSRDVRFCLAQRLIEALDRPEGIEILGVDIPIGLLDAAVPGGRECDRQARALLGTPRASSVFSPPVRGVLGAASYDDAKRRSRASSAHALALSRQGYAILGKIEEVDRLMTPELQRRVIEVHPEVTFAELNGGRAVVAKKKRREGRRVDN